MSEDSALTRREALLLGAAAMIAAPLDSARADATEVDQSVRQLMGPIQPREGRVHLKIKETAESGANEPVAVVVDSPQTPADHVKAIHVLAEGNPHPVVSSWYLTPRSGRAEVAFRMRLAKTQVVRAYAVMSDGSVWLDRQEVKVTIGGCGG